MERFETAMVEIVTLDNDDVIVESVCDTQAPLIDQSDSTPADY